MQGMVLMARSGMGGAAVRVTFSGYGCGAGSQIVGQGDDVWCSCSWSWSWSWSWLCVTA